MHFNIIHDKGYLFTCVIWRLLIDFVKYKNILPIKNDQNQRHFISTPSHHPKGLRIYTHVDVAGQRGTVFRLVRLLDVAQVDLRACNDDADEGLVVRAHTLHRVLQPLGEVGGLVAGAPHCGHERECLRVGVTILMGASVQR